MTATPERTIRCTIHWLERGEQRSKDLLFPNQPIGDLIPVLLESLGLDAGDNNMPFGLRPGPRAPAWDAGQTLLDVGIRDGDHVWLTAVARTAASEHDTVRQRAQQYTCALVLPGGTVVTLPPNGQEITRPWLFEQLPRVQQLKEQARFYLRRSPLQAVSSSVHCRLRPGPSGSWVAETERKDVQTLLNGLPLVPHRPAPLQPGDTLQPGGEAGPSLTIILRPRTSALQS